MPKYTVHVPDSPSRRRLTAGQWLALCRVAEKGEGKTRVFDLPSPVRVSLVAEDERTYTRHICRTSIELFRLFAQAGTISAVAWRGEWLGVRGLYELNRARFTPALRKGGLNIVRHFLMTQRGSMIPLGPDFAALLSFLEIRPVYSPALAQSPARGLDIMSRVTKDIKQGKTGTKKRPHAPHS